MVVRATRILVGRCRQISGRYAGQRQRNRGLLLPRWAPAGPCLATVTSATAVPKASSLPGPSTSPSRSTRPPKQQQQQQQQQQQLRDRALAVVLSRRALSFFPTPGHRQQQQQQQREHGVEGSSERPMGSKRSVEYGGRARRAGGRSGSGTGSGTGTGTVREERLEEEAGEEIADPNLEKESDRVWTVPNVITMGRIAFCPVLAGLIVTSQHEMALAGLLAASLTDWLDGYIARKWNQKSVLGGFLDPLADKIMVTTVALALGQEGIIPSALVAVMVGRDALLIAGSLAYRYKTRRKEDSFFDLDSLDYKVAPSTLSKVNTVLQFGTLWLGLTNAVYLVPGDAVFSALCVTTGVATLASGANYLLVSGLKPRGKLGKRLMIQRENLQERYREREVLVRERMGVGRERMRVRQGELNDRLKARRRKVAVDLKDRIKKRRLAAASGGAASGGAASGGGGKGGPQNKGG